MNDPPTKMTSIIRRLWNSIAKGWIDDVPEEIATCEFDCRELRCELGQWKTCEHRLRHLASVEEHRTAGTGVANDSNVSPAPRNRDSVPLIPWALVGGLSDVVDYCDPSDAEQWLPCPTRHGLHTFASRVEDDSMTLPYPGARSYPPGTLIYVDPDKAVCNGARVVAKNTATGEATFKIYMEDAGQRYLRPLNAQYSTLPMGADYRVIGVVIGAYWQED